MIESSSAYVYLQESKWHRDTIKQLKKFGKDVKIACKTYPQAPVTPLTFSWSLDEARIKPLIQGRRSLRKYSNEILKLDDVSYLMWASQGITAKVGNHFFRSVPSAGALYPYETYLVLTGIEGVKDGLYHFNVNDFTLENLIIGEYAEELSRTCLHQKFIAKAPVTIIWTGLVERCMHKYGERALRYMLLDLGHVCQNTLLGAESLGCGGCPVAAFFDDELAKLLQLDTQLETPLYGVSIGRKPKKAKNEE